MSPARRLQEGPIPRFPWLSSLLSDLNLAKVGDLVSSAGSLLNGSGEAGDRYPSVARRGMSITSFPSGLPDEELTELELPSHEQAGTSAVAGPPVLT